MSFPKYPLYKNSGIEWLGLIPEHWGISKIKKVSERVTKGTTPTTIGKDFTDNGILFLKVESISDCMSIINEMCVYIDQETHGLLSRSALQENDVLISIAGAIGRTAIISKSNLPANTNQAIAIVRPISKLILSKWICYTISSKYYSVYFELNMVKTAQANLSLEALSNSIIFIPSLFEQESIISFLDHETSKIDALVLEQKNLIDLLKEKRQAVISHAVTKGLDPNVKMKDSGIEWLGMVPEEWDVVRIATLFREINECGNDELPVLSVSIHNGVSDKELDDEELDKKITRSEDRTKYKKVQKEDLVYNMMRAWQGSFGTVSVEGMVSPAYVVARPQKAFITKFVEYILRTPQAIEQMRRYSQGVTDFRLRLYWDEFKNIKITLPPIDDQLKILGIIDNTILKYDALVAEAERSIYLLQERRTALISAAVTGKIDLQNI